MSDYKNILVTIDFSESTDQVIKAATDLASRYQATLSLMHVVEYLPPMDFTGDPGLAIDWIANEDDLIKNSKKSLQKLASRYDLSSLSQIVQLGTPKYEISRVADEQKMDLIIVGSHGRHGLGRLLGSTADGIIHNAHCDVLAVRIKDK